MVLSLLHCFCDPCETSDMVIVKYALTICEYEIDDITLN